MASIPFNVGPHLDMTFRRALVLSSLFTKSWGHPETLKQMAKYRREVMSKRQVVDVVRNLNTPVTIKTESVKNGVTTIDGHFHSQHAQLFPEQMPGPVACAHFRAILPKEPGPVCLHISGTGDHSYKRREWWLVGDLLKRGVGALLVQNPFYRDRKPPSQFRSSLENVSDLFVMGGALIAECNFLFQWAKQRGYGPFCISGISMGGFLASLAASNAVEPLAVVPILSWTTASPAYTKGAIAPAINYKQLQAQLEDRAYIDKLRRIPDVHWVDKMHELSLASGETLALSMMRVLMDDFTSLANYPAPLDTSLCHAVIAAEDKYVLRGLGTPTFQDVWPGMTVEVVDGHGHVSAYLTKHKLFRRRISAVLERQAQTQAKNV